MSDLANKKGKDKDTHEPAGSHEPVLHLVLWPGILANGGGGFSGEVETPNVSASNPKWI